MDAVSTAGDVSSTSGRGVGLSAIRAMVREAHGDVTITGELDGWVDANDLGAGSLRQKGGDYESK